MDQELATRQDAAVAVQPSTSQAVLAVIARAAADPQCNVDNMQRLLDMQLQVMALEKKARYDEAMARLQQELPTIEKNKKGANGKYASIENIDARIRPLLRAEGFHFTFTSGPADGGKMRIDGQLHHRDGHAEASSIILAIDTSGSKNATQGGGSTVSYGQRYLKCMMLDLVTINEDDDGRGVAYVTADQVQTIETLIHDIPDSPAGYRLRCQAKLLGAMGANTIAQIPAERFREAVNKLDSAAKGPKA